MESRLTDTGKAAAIDLIAAGLTAFAAAGGADPSSHDQAMVMTRELEILGRQIKAMQIGLVGAINQHGFHKVDGHASAKVMVRHLAHLSNAEASRRASAARALKDLPAVAATFAAGTVGFCQVERISRAWANPRVRERLITPLLLARLSRPRLKLPNRPPHPLGQPRKQPRRNQPPQRRTRLRQTQPLQRARLHRPPRRQRRLAHPSPRRQRNPLMARVAALGCQRTTILEWSLR